MKAHAAEIGVRDVQLRLTPLEEVFLNVTQKAELAHAEVCLGVKDYVVNTLFYLLF